MKEPAVRTVRRPAGFMFQTLLTVSIVASLSGATWYVLQMVSQEPDRLRQTRFARPIESAAVFRKPVSHPGTLEPPASPSEPATQRDAATPMRVPTIVISDPLSRDLIERTFDNFRNRTGEAQEGSSEAPLFQWRQQFVSDTRDAAWSPMAEGQTESYLTERLAPDIELLQVKCVSRLCEVQAVGTSADSSQRAANEWLNAMLAMSEEAWWPGYDFDQPNVAMWRAPDGRMLLVSYLIRKGD